MGYQYQGDLTIEQELAEAEKVKAEVQARIEGRRKQLAQLRAARREVRNLVAHEHRLVAEIHKITGTPMPIPEPLYGGRKGLLAAVQEIREFDARKKVAA